MALSSEKIEIAVYDFIKEIKLPTDIPDVIKNVVVEFAKFYLNWKHAYTTEQDENVTIQRTYKDLTNLITMLESSKAKLKILNEDFKKREQTQGRVLKQKQTHLRRGRTAIFTREEMQQFTKLIPSKSSQKYAIAIDDVGTPVADQAMEQSVSFDSIKIHIDQHINKEVTKHKIDVNKFRRSKRRRAAEFGKPPILNDDIKFNSPSIDSDDHSDPPFLNMPSETKSSDQIVTLKSPKQNFHSSPLSPRERMRQRNLGKDASLQRFFPKSEKKQKRDSKKRDSKKRKRDPKSEKKSKTSRNSRKTKTRRGGSITLLTPSASILTPVVAEVVLDQYPDNMNVSQKENEQELETESKNDYNQGIGNEVHQRD